MARLPGKKIGTLDINLELAGKYGAPTNIKLPLRCNTESKTPFLTEYEGEIYKATTVGELRAMVKVAVQDKMSVDWVRYIVPEYSAMSTAKFGHANRWGHNYDTLSSSDTRPGTKRVKDYDPEYDEHEYEDADKAVAGIFLSWYLIDISSPFRADKDGRHTRLSRSVDGETLQADDRSELHDQELPDGAIEYTPERLTALVAIRDAIGELDRKLLGIFGSALVADVLDNIADNKQFLLTSGTPPDEPDRTWAKKGKKAS